MDAVCNMLFYTPSTSQYLINTTRLCSSARTSDTVPYSSLDVFNMCPITEVNPVGILCYNERY